MKHPIAPNALQPRLVAWDELKLRENRGTCCSVHISCSTYLARSTSLELVPDAMGLEEVLSRISDLDEKKDTLCKTPILFLTCDDLGLFCL